MKRHWMAEYKTKEQEILNSVLSLPVNYNERIYIPLSYPEQLGKLINKWIDISLSQRLMESLLIN